MKLIIKIRNVLYTFFRTIIIAPYNFFLCLKYPFWRMRNIWTGKSAGYMYTWYDDIPKGWRKAFGKQLSKDLKTALKKNGELFSFRFSQIKEKWGELCLYNEGGSKEILDLISYYEHLSICYCINCGRPARYISNGYVGYWCEKCGRKETSIKRLTKANIPVFQQYDPITEQWCKVDLGIDYYKKWDIPREN